MPRGLPGCTPGLIPNLGERWGCRGVLLSVVAGHAEGEVETYRGRRGRSGKWGVLRLPPAVQNRSDADELLEAVAATGVGRGDGGVRVHPGDMDAAGDELARRLTLLPPAADLGPVAFPDLDAGATGDVEGAIGVEGNPVGVADVLLQADERTVGGEDLPAVVLTVHHVDEIVCGDQQLVRHVELARVGARPAGHRPEIETLRNENRIAATEGEEMLALRREAVDQVLAVPIRDEDIAIGRLDRMGWHIERLAVGALVALGTD